MNINLILFSTLFFFISCTKKDKNEEFKGECKTINIEKRFSKNCIPPQKNFCRAIFCGKINIFDYDSLEIKDCVCR